MTSIKNKFLCFDIVGTILDKSTKAVKKNLQDSQLERRIKNANFDKIICIGNINDIFNGLEDMGQHKEIEFLFQIQLVTDKILFPGLRP